MERLQSYDPLPSGLIHHLGNLYELSTTTNAEVRLRFYEVALSDPSSDAAKQFAIDAVKWVVGEDCTGVVKGRMKFCRPILQSCAQVDKKLVLKSWDRAKKAFHPIARKLIEKVLLSIVFFFTSSLTLNRI